MAHGEQLPGKAVAVAQRLRRHRLAVVGHHRAPEAGDSHRPDPGRRDVGRLLPLVLVEPAPHPPRPLVAQGDRRVRPGEQQGDGAVLVEAPGLVDQHPSPVPAVARPRLPSEGRSMGVDAQPLDGRDQVEAQGVAGEGAVEAEVEGIVLDQGLGGEAHDTALAEPEVLPRVAVVAGAVAGEEAGELRLHDPQVVVGGEDDVAAVTPGRGADLGAGGDDEGRGAGRRQPERELGPGRAGREQVDADELEELGVEAVGHLVQPVQRHLGHPGEQLDEGDPRVGQVVVRPRRAVLGDEALGLVDDVLEGAVVEVGARDRHGPSSVITLQGSRRTGRPGSAGRWWP